MINGFETTDKAKADAALLVYAVYRSRNKERGPSGLNMWGQIERFARTAAKRSRGVGVFLDVFKRKMACDTITPHFIGQGVTGAAQVMEDGSIIVKEGSEKRSFLTDIVGADEAHQKEIIRNLYKETQLIVLLVRARLEDEKNYVEVEKVEKN